MRRWTVFALLLCSVALAATPVQQGHPLSGTWAGNWGPNPAQRTHLRLVMSFDGEKVSGILNPGPDAIELANVLVNVTNWTVRIEGQTRDKAGNAVRIIAEGRIENLGSSNRTIAGTWRQGDATGDFKVTRD